MHRCSRLLIFLVLPETFLWSPVPASTSASQGSSRRYSAMAVVIECKAEHPKCEEVGCRRAAVLKTRGTIPKTEKVGEEVAAGWQPITVPAGGDLRPTWGRVEDHVGAVRPCLEGTILARLQ